MWSLGLAFRFMARVRILITVGIAVPVVSVLIGLVTGPASGQQHWPGWFEFLRAHPWPSLIVLTAVAVGLASIATLTPKKEMGLPEAADELAAAVDRDWSYEAQWRKVFDPYPLPVNWVPADPDLVVPWPTLVRLAATRPGASAADGAGWAAGPASLAGGDSDLADVLVGVPTRRLVVLGDKGAGKTILLLRLVLDLLPRRKPGDPVPILLPLASWNPTEDDLQTWMVNWLITDRAGLAGLAKAGKRVSLARALVEDGRIFPVLDGLDEIPEKVRGAAIAKINDWMKPGQGLILAARTSDYRAVVHPSDGAEVLLTGAAGIELRPLAIGVVTGYLKDSAGGTGASGRWDSVIATFTAEHPPPAAKVLTTPLMAALARVAYNPRPGEDIAAIPLHPSELLDATLFPDGKAIENYLFDHFIPASYRRHPDPKHPSRRYRWTREQAERWLVFLAQNLETRQAGSTDIAWWKLPTAAPKRLVGIALGVVVGLAVGLGYPFVGFGVGLTAGIMAGLAARRWLQIRKEGLGPGMAGGLIGGVIGGVVILVFLGPGSAALLAKLLSGGLAIGIAMSVMAGFIPALLGGFIGSITVALYENYSVFEGVRNTVGSGYHIINALSACLLAVLFVELVGRNVPARGIRWSPIWFACGLICSIVMGYVIWNQVGPVAGLTVGLAAAAASGLVAGVAESVATDLAGAANPQTVLRRDRTTFIASWLGLGVALGVAVGLADSLALDPSGHPYGFEYGTKLGLTQLAATGLIFGFVQATWGPFTVARWYLAASRRLPWRLMTFLHDAHAYRGVLRQVGAVYQFRHVELQRRLARPLAKATSGMDYCPFDVDSDTEALNLRTVSVPTLYGTLTARVSKERLSDTGTMYIHGVGADWTTWTPIIRATVELGLQAHDQIFIDLPGFGDSENRLNAIKIADVGSALLDVAASLGYRTVRIVGHSMGGFLTLDMASRCPDRVKSIHLVASSYFSILASIQHPLKSLALCPEVATVFGLQYLVSRAGEAGLVALRLLYKLGTFRLLLFPFASHPFKLRGSVVKALCRQQNPQGMLQTAASGADYDADEQWSKIKCPIIAVFGDKDRLIPRVDMIRLLKCQPTAKCRLIDDSGHLLHVERPFDVIEALELWS